MSSLSSPNFATSYTLGSTGVVNGSISYLYTSLPLRIPSKSHQIYLRQLVPGYRRLIELVRADDSHLWEIWHKGRRVDRKNTLLYGRLFLPSSTLQALYLRHLSPTRLLRLSCVSDAGLRNGGSILALLQEDHGKYSTEYLYSSDSSMLGFRGLYNFGFDPRKPYGTASDDTDGPANSSAYPLLSGSDHHHGRLSAGGELYFSPLNKSGGVSTAVRFTTLPTHPGFPYTMTLTLNPLMGSISSSYAVQAMEDLSFCSRFNFNFYSYESDVQLGMEMWRRKFPDAATAWARRMLRPEWKLQGEGGLPALENFDSVVKAKVDQKWKIGLLWEGRINELLVSFGAALDLKNRDRVLGSIGVEVCYSS